MSRVAATVQRDVVRVRDEMFEVEVFSDGEGPTLVYLCGGGMPGATSGWNEMLEHLSRRFHVVAPMHPGFGASTGVEHLRSVPDLVYFYLDLLDALELRGVMLVGHSFGGMVAAELAAVQPERFSHLALIAPLGLWNDSYPVLDFFACKPSELVAVTFHDPTSERVLAVAKAPSDHEDMIQYMLDRAKTTATVARFLWPIPNKGLADRLHRISAPTLVAWGASDAIASPRYADDFRDGIRGARVEVIEDAGHVPPFERPVETADLITAFLGEA